MFKRKVLYAIDSSRLPHKEVWLKLKNAKQVALAIREMRIRGAPLIGVAAAYGLALEALGYRGNDVERLKKRVLKTSELLRNVRPTGRNLSWAIDRCLKAIEDVKTVKGIKKPRELPMKMLKRI